MIRLFDTATRSFQPLDPGAAAVRLYVCGITPYDGGHLGHAFTYHTFDVLTRRLRSLGHRVRSVRNVTDVDDDIMRVSAARGIGWRELAEQVTREFDRDMAAIDVLPVDADPRASQHVPAMVDWISRLAGAGFAYAVDGWVYFEVAQLPGYGCLSGLGVEEMLRLSRERGADPDDPRKRGPLDFVLWQPSRTGEPSWASPWGAGRPGWHIECSVLATQELGTPIDVHGGGDDLIFPHHESEIAQAAGAGISPYVRLWVHVAMVGYQGQKMSKSVGNLVFVNRLLERVPGATVRLLLAGHHHRAAWEYTERELDVADARRRGYAAAAGAAAALYPAEAERWRADFLARIDDDLDVPGALVVADRLAERLRGGGAGSGAPVQGAGLLAQLLDTVGAASAAS
ncbi:MAG: class I tRNA ligase family protein [Candidatus Dormibacteria bacterium]